MTQELNTLPDEEMYIDDVEINYVVAEYIAGQLFDNCTSSVDCKAINCPSFRGINTPDGTGFHCEVYEKENPPYHCPIVKKQMITIAESLLIWTDDFCNPET